MQEKPKLRWVSLMLAGLCCVSASLTPLAANTEQDEDSAGNVPCDGVSREYKISAMQGEFTESGSGPTKEDAKQDALNRLADTYSPTCNLCPDGDPCPGPMWFIQFQGVRFDGPWWDPHNQEWVANARCTAVIFQGACFSCE